MPINIEEVTTEVAPSGTRSGSSSETQQPAAQQAPVQWQVEKLIRQLAERILRVTAH